MIGRPVSYGILSSAAPTVCGLATFTAALAKELERKGNVVSLVRVLDEAEEPSSSKIPIIANLIGSDWRTVETAARALNRCDVAIVQLEYGLYGGEDGDDVVRLLHLLAVPTIADLHTVLSRPLPNQRDVLNEVIKSVDSVVVMTKSAEQTLREVFEVGNTPISVIPHGATVVGSNGQRERNARPTILTWGLLGPGKGIEWVIDTMATLKDLVPTPLYIVAGRTHPKVLVREGESYRRKLMDQVVDIGVGDMVHFDNTYRDLLSLTSLIENADVVVLPYDSKDQATSGVLVDAIAAGRPVIATPFPHAIELLCSGAGIIVDHEDPSSLARALRDVLTNSTVSENMKREARRLSLGLSWESVAVQYLELNEFMLKRTDVSA